LTIVPQPEALTTIASSPPDARRLSQASILARVMASAGASSPK